MVNGAAIKKISAGKILDSKGNTLIKLTKINPL